jgi:uncharacterized membrane protein YgcG
VHVTVFRRWWFWAVAAAVLCAIVLVVGLRVRQARVAGDPSFRALAVVALARDGAQHPLTKDQIRAIVPLLRSLRDLAPDEREATQAVVREILNTLTPAQRAELRTRRALALGRRSARPGSGGPGFGGGRFTGGGGDGSGPPGRLQVRARILDRAIVVLEERAKE